MASTGLQKVVLQCLTETTAFIADTIVSSDTPLSPMPHMPFGPLPLRNATHWLPKRDESVDELKNRRAQRQANGPIAATSKKRRAQRLGMYLKIQSISLLPRTFSISESLHQQGVHLSGEALPPRLRHVRNCHALHMFLCPPPQHNLQLSPTVSGLSGRGRSVRCSRTGKSVDVDAPRTDILDSWESTVTTTGPPTYAPAHASTGWDLLGAHTHVVGS
jgi:hypothetical protein